MIQDILSCFFLKEQAKFYLFLIYFAFVNAFLILINELKVKLFGEKIGFGIDFELIYKIMETF